MLLKNTPKLWLNKFPWKHKLGHKYSRGKVVIYGSKKEFTGATMLAAQAALRTGTGSVKMICSKNTIQIYSVKFPSILKVEINNIKQLAAFLNKEKITSMLIGPGSGLNKKIKEINWKPDLIVASYHGIPKKYFDKGDPYHCYCHKTTRLISEKFKSIEIKTTFQSRFGPQEWLKPYTDKTFESLPTEGKKNILVICPGFSSDCVETLEEILIQGKESFINSGGENFDMVPCLNDNKDHILLLQSLIQRNI